MNRTQLNSTQLNSTQLNSTQLNSTQLNSTQLNSTQLNSTQLNSTQLNSTQLNSTQLNSTQLNSTQLNSTQLNSTTPTPRESLQQTRADKQGHEETHDGARVIVSSEAFHLIDTASCANLRNAKTLREKHVRARPSPMPCPTEYDPVICMACPTKWLRQLAHSPARFGKKANVR